MDKHAYYQLGLITKAHGLAGELVAFLDTDVPQHYEGLTTVWVALSGAMIPFAVQRISITQERAIVKLEGIDDYNAAIAIKDCELHLPITQLPPLEDQQFYYHEIVGFGVEDVHEGPIGTVQHVLDLASQPLLSVDHQGAEVLVPLSLLQRVDKQKKNLLVDLPEGLLALYV